MGVEIDIVLACVPAPIEVPVGFVDHCGPTSRGVLPWGADAVGTTAFLARQPARQALLIVHGYPHGTTQHLRCCRKIRGHSSIEEVKTFAKAFLYTR